MNSKSFLLYGGLVLVGMALVGSLGVGPTAIQSVFGKWLWFDQASNILHLVLGLIALIAYRLVNSDQMRRYIIAVIGFIMLASALAGFMFAGNPIPNLGFLNLEQPLESLVNLAFAAWALRFAYKPSDDTHHYGHDKVAFISSGFEGAMISAAGRSRA